MYSQKISREVVLSRVSVLNDENFKLAKPYASVTFHSLVF
jgi:hypothetical protein